MVRCELRDQRLLRWTLEALADGEDREGLELRVAGGDEDDVQPKQGEEDAVANDRCVADFVIWITCSGLVCLRRARGDDREQREESGISRGVDEKERGEGPGAGRGRDQASNRPADPEAEIHADALQRVAGMAAVGRSNRGQERVIAGPEDAVG